MSRRGASPRAHGRATSLYDEARDLCVKRLEEAFSAGSSLFDRQLRDARWQPVEGTEDVTGSAICLLGLHRAGVDFGEIGVHPARTLDALALRLRESAYAGGLGLVIWASAVLDAMPLSELLRRAGLSLEGTRELVAARRAP